VWPVGGGGGYLLHCGRGRSVPFVPCATDPTQSMLSLMVNPASPPLLSVSEEDHKAAQRYRLYIVYRLPGLQFLDSAPVSGREREEAKAQVKGGATRFIIHACQSHLSSPRPPSPPSDTRGHTNIGVCACRCPGCVFGGTACKTDG
jgi:hypothetical protein